MSEVKKCSKCGSESISKKGVNLAAYAWLPITTTAYICEKCGYIELYREMKGKKVS